MAGKNYAFTVASKQKGADADVITLDNAASLTIYQLRQELTRRGVFDEIFGADGEKRNISFNDCLQVELRNLSIFFMFLFTLFLLSAFHDLQGVGGRVSEGKGCSS